MGGWGIVLVDMVRKGLGLGEDVVGRGNSSFKGRKFRGGRIC